MLKTITLFIVSIILSGCVTQNSNNSIKINLEPKWLQNPYIDNDNIAAVGCAQIHFKGISAQKDLAISRAINRIATQKNVIVQNITYRQKKNANGKKIISKLESSSLHTVSTVKISTKTKAIYKKPDGEICAWVIQK